MDSTRQIDLPAGISIRYRVSGEGDVPLVFIHGYSMSLDSWDQVIGRLPARYRGYAYDLRGFGKSARAKGYELADHVGDLASLLDQLEIEGAVLIGHSLGGTIAQLYAVAHPERISALILTNVRAANIPAPDLKAGRVEERAAAYVSPEAARPILWQRMPAYFNPANVTKADLGRFVDIALEADLAALRETLISIYTVSQVPDEAYRRIAAPVLFVSGSHDEVTPARNLGPALAVLPHVESVTIDGSGHSPMWERPVEWSEFVYGFLARKL